MKYGIYYAYWEREWGGDFLPYVEKVKRLGFDILEIACGDLVNCSDGYMRELGRAAADNGLILTGGYGPRPCHNLGSAQPQTVEEAFRFYAETFRKMELASVMNLCGALYSYWPVDFAGGFDKRADCERSARSMRRLGAMAAERGVTLHMEVLNRFEGYMLNECAEAVAYVKAVDMPNVRVMLDTFHMNIEEDSFSDAIRLAGPLLGHFHVGEANRRPPYAGGRMPWREIGNALHAADYDGYVVMEPFVVMGGQVGRDIGIWRDISHGASPEQLDDDAAQSVRFLRALWE